jgi:hypothetical protein
MANCTANQATPAAKPLEQRTVAAKGCKPEAPVELVLSAQREGAVWKVTAEATAMGAFEGMTLQLKPGGSANAAAFPLVHFGALQAGETQVANAEIAAGSADEVYVSARVAMNGMTVGRFASLRLGTTERLAPPVRIVELPNGERLDLVEVKP